MIKIQKNNLHASQSVNALHHKKSLEHNDAAGSMTPKESYISLEIRQFQSPSDQDKSPSGVESVSLSPAKMPAVGFQVTVEPGSKN